MLRDGSGVISPFGKPGFRDLRPKYAMCVRVLDGRRDWYSTGHLRHQTGELPLSWYVATDVEMRNLRAVHTAVTRGVWIDLKDLDRSYLVAIPNELYAWLRKSKWHEVMHHLAVYYVAMARQDDAEDVMLDQIHCDFLPALKEGFFLNHSPSEAISALARSMAPRFLQPSYREDGSIYFGQGLFADTADTGLPFSFEPHVYGISETDDFRLDGKMWDDRKGKAVKITGDAELSQMRRDRLLRMESDSEAFFFLQYARESKQVWHDPSDLPSINPLPREEKESYIYFIWNGASVKIGTSANPMARMRNLQTAHDKPLELLGTFPGGPAREKEIHGQLSNRRSSGEWFSLTKQEALDFLKTSTTPRQRP